MMPKQRTKSSAKRGRPANRVPLDERYRVGWGRPPKAHQFKPGQSGNPSGAKSKAKSLVSDLKALFERALNSTVKLPRGQRDQIATKFDAGIEKLFDQFASGDHRARRDVFEIAEKFGIDLKGSQHKGKPVDATTAAEFRQALLDRNIPPRWLPPIDEAGPEPPPDPPLPPDAEIEPEQ